MYICTNFKHIIKLYILKIFFFKKSKTIQNSVTSIFFFLKSLHCSSPWVVPLWISAFLENTDAPTWQTWQPPWKCRLQKIVSLGNIWYFMMSMLSNKMSPMSPHSWKSFSYHIWVSFSIYTLFWTESFGFDPTVEETEQVGLHGIGLATHAVFIWLAIPIVLYFIFFLSPWRAFLICIFAHS